MTFVLDCCDREVISFVAKKGRGLPSWMAQEQVLLAVNRRFGSVNQVPTHLQLLTDNGSAYTSQKTKQFLKALGIEDCKTAVSSPQSDGMAESFVKTLMRDYLPFIDLENAQAALSCLPEIIERYNEEHPHSALGYLSPMEYRQKKGLTEPKTGQEEPICLIPGYLLRQKVNRTEKQRLAEEVKKQVIIYMELEIIQFECLSSALGNLKKLSRVIFYFFLEKQTDRGELWLTEN